MDPALLDSYLYVGIGDHCRRYHSYYFYLAQKKGGANGDKDG